MPQLEVLVDPTETLGYYKISKTASTSLRSWLVDDGWYWRPAEGWKGLAFSMWREPHERLRGAVSESLMQVWIKTGLPYTEILKHIKKGLWLGDNHACPQLYYIWNCELLREGRLALIPVSKAKGHERGVRKFLLDHGVAPPSSPFPVKNATSTDKWHNDPDLVEATDWTVHTDIAQFIAYQDQGLWNWLNDTGRAWVHDPEGIMRVVHNRS